ncbi:filamentous haemagglutinin family protein [Methylibium sp.]|uniref:filamentous haemagglutinin family protein n=1 Tax=Methylibium sp. TaxID=2067992 RepID=UPI003D0987E3
MKAHRQPRFALSRLNAGSAVAARCEFSSSLAALAAAGVLGCVAPGPAAAQGAGTVLPKGTLPVLRGVVGGQAIVRSPVDTATGRLLTIDQSSQRAIIDWRSFNIAGGSEVRFNQPNNLASTLNRIYSLDPSLLQGKLSANGQILLINQNGILFDRGAQVNAYSFIASTLNISNERFNAGLTSRGLTAAAAEGGYDDSGNTLATRPDGTRPEAIVLGQHGDPAAAAPSITAQPGGSIVLIAPRIDNRSAVIASPDGQVLLAAGSKAYLALADDENGPGLRGMRVEIEADAGAPVNLSSMIRNAGEISADRGNVTLAALAINQAGRVSASTAIQSNGSIWLQARSRDSQQGGSVSFEAGSVTEAKPDAADKGFLPESQSFKGSSVLDDRRALIQVEGKTIVNQGSVSAPGGRITLNAGDAADPTAARIYLGEGSSTSVAGTWADVAYDSNLVSFKVTSNELKDSPDQKSGLLKGSTVTVDLRKGSALLDVSGYAAARKRSVAEETATGGELVLQSAGSVIQRQGATLDASGGGYRYAGGTSATTKLLGADGKVYDITTAPEAKPYTRILDRFDKRYERWGQTASYTNLLYGYGEHQDAYVEGKAGGSISIGAATGLVLDGTLKGGATAGPTQLAKAPRGATLAIGTYNSTSNEFGDLTRIGNVTFAQGASDTLGRAFVATTALSQAQRDHFTLAAEQLFGAATSPQTNVYQQNGFESVELNSNGRIAVPAEVHIDGPVGGALTLRGSQVDVAGKISMPAGTLTLQAVATVSPISADQTTANSGVTVRSGAQLSTAGVWVNQASADGAYVGAPLPTAKSNGDGSAAVSLLNGGTLTVASTVATQFAGATLLESGAVLDVSGGGALDKSGKLTAGNGGTLSLSQGSSVNAVDEWLQADLRGYAAGNGGTLSILVPDALLTSAGGAAPAGTSRFGPSLFSDHGFGAVRINTLNGLSVAEGTTIQATQQNLVVDRLKAVGLATGGNLASVATLATLPAEQRNAVKIGLAAVGGAGSDGTNAKLVIGRNAFIATDPKGEIKVSAVDGLDIDGTLSAPGGAITATLRKGIAGTAQLHLGEHSTLSTAGTFVRQPSDRGLLQGSVIGGGSITLAAQNTGIRTDAGSVLDVSGASRIVDVLTGDATRPLVQQRVDGDAGSLLMSAQGASTLDGTLRGRAPSAQGAGGSFAFEFALPQNADQPVGERRIVVGQAAPATGVNEVPIAIDALSAGGFQKLRLQSENIVEFRGDADLNFARGIRIDAPEVDVSGGGKVRLAGAAIAIGQSQKTSFWNGQNYEQQEASPVLPTLTGAGRFEARGQTIDLFGSLALGGVSQASFISENDIRLTGRLVKGSTTGLNGSVESSLVGGLTTSGDLLFHATQLYPTTRSDFTVAVKDQPGDTLTPGGRIVIAGNGKPGGEVYSAGGRLTLQADHIEQGGTVKAPLGEISLQAGSTLDLAAGSVTSVSAAGSTIPYGTTDAGVIWNYRYGSGATTQLDAPTPAGKRIALSGPAVDVHAGATVDVSGGGDVQAVEFVPGTGGSKNTLLSDNTFAIIPAAGLSSMPIDADTASLKDLGFGFATAKPDSALYDSLHIGPGAAVPEGDYLLLPGRYALLPGAYLVQLQTGSAYRKLQPGAAPALANGQAVVAGYRSVAGTSIRESQTVGVVVRPGADAKQESDYNVSTARFFADLASQQRRDAPRLPIDAGKLAIANANTLRLDGQFITNPATVDSRTGRGSEVDISGSRIAVVDRLGNAAVDASYLQLEAAGLSHLGGSVLLGGTRSDLASGVQITTGASDVLVANTAEHPLELPELLIAATNRIDVQAGSVLSGSGSSVADSRNITTEASGALIRLANSAQVAVDRGATPDASVGTVSIQAGATLKASKALLIDATQTTRSQGRLQAGGTGGAGGAVSLASGRVSLGQTAGVPGIDDGLVLSNTDLAAFDKLDALALKGYAGIDFYGAAALGSSALKQLTLDTAALRGKSVAGSPAANASIEAQQFAWRNLAGGSTLPGTPGSGSLSIDARRIEIGAGDKSVGGYASVAMNAAGEAVAEGSGTTRVAGRWTMQAARVTVDSGANQTWSASDASNAANPVYAPLSIAAAPGAAPLSEPTGLGGRLRVEGKSVAVATTVTARSGSLTLAAMGSDAGDGVSLGATAVIDAAGAVKDFNGAKAFADAGQVVLGSAHGSVTMAAAAKVDVSGAAQGGDAGTLLVSARSVQLDGELRGAAGAAQEQGKFRLDAGTPGNFSALNAKLNQGGFTEERDIRVRSGDLAVAAGDLVKAQHVTLAADGGRIDVAGRIDASSATGGGSVSLHAQTGLALAAGSRIDASGSSTASGAAAAASNGGAVKLSTRSGAMSFDAASQIDVRAGAKGQAGSVVFSVPRDNANQMLAPTLQGTVLSQRHAGDAPAEVAVEANRVYAVGSSITAADIDGYAADHAGFVASANVAALLGQVKGDDGRPQGNVHVRGATELAASGDLLLAEGWDLTTPQWLANGEPGTLTLRAAGDLTLSSSLGFANDNLIDGKTWNLRLVGGADLGAANALSTLPAAALVGDAGSVVLSGDTAKLRTGTGRIEIAAARDFRMDSNKAVVYTAGRPGEVDTAANGNNRWTRDGGDISVNVGRDAVGHADELITEWLRRPRLSIPAFADLKPADWWAYRPNFQQGLGTLGGGNVQIIAGHDVDGLSAMLPTTGRTYRDAAGQRQVDVQGGGDLHVQAGNDVRGGDYLVARGTGSIKAGGSVGAAVPTQLFVMGASSGDVPAQASLRVEAGQDVHLQSVNNPTALYQTNSAGTGPSFGTGSSLVSTFFTYAPNSAVSLAAEGGDVSVGGSPAQTLRTIVASQQGLASGNLGGTAAYPPNFDAVAFGGDVLRAADEFSPMVLYPSTSGSARLLAGGSVENLLLTVSSKATGGGLDIDSAVTLAARRLTGDDLTNGSGSGAEGPPPAGPYAYDVQALTGSISDSSFAFPAASRIRAAEDITNVNLVLQNLAATDVTEVRADHGDVRPASTGIEIRGPGRLKVQAGRSIDLGIANAGPGGFLGGLASTGNTTNPALATADGARLTLIAGVEGDVNLARLDASYTELIEAGKAQDKERGQKAIDAVFAGNKIGAGDINSFRTSIQTYGGSGIDLWAPGGNIVVGLTTPEAGKSIGLITNSGGAIRSYLSGDFNINQGKVLTAQGGDIVIYTGNGSIDAGRGAKTSLSTPPPKKTPVYQLDDQGNFVLDANGQKITQGYLYTLSASAAGSGILSLTSDPDGLGPRTAPTPGSIFLFAPKGTIDAGEAGIVSGADIFIAAQTVLNASNISASGSSVGVPTVESGSLASSLASSGAPTTSKAADDAAAAATNAARAAAAAETRPKPAILTVEVLGFGENNCKEGQKDCLAK